MVVCWTIFVRFAHNESVKPKVETSNIRQSGSELSFQLFKVEGADVSIDLGEIIFNENHNLKLTDISGV